MQLILPIWLFVEMVVAPPVTVVPLSDTELKAQAHIEDREGAIVQIGDEAPDFHLRDLHGKAVSLSQLRGKVVLLNFWATWCGPCRSEMPTMEHLYQTLPRKDFEILAISTDPQGAAVTRPFQQEMGLTFPILHDPDMRVGMTYGTRTLPLTFMVDRQGRIRKKIFGARDWDSPEARDLIQRLMRS